MLGKRAQHAADRCFLVVRRYYGEAIPSHSSSRVPAAGLALESFFPMRRLGINLLYLVPGEVGGSETAARATLGALREVATELDVVVYCAPEARESLAGEPWARAWEIVESPAPSRSKPRRTVAEMGWLPRRARRDGIELLHSMGTTNPVVSRVPTVVSVLDVIYHH